MMKLKELVQGKVYFQFFRKNELYYKTESGFEFRVPVEDVGDGIFKNEDRAIIFMRYIRKELELINKENEKED